MSNSIYLNPYEQLGRLGSNIASANASGVLRSLSFSQGPFMTPEEMKTLSQKYMGDDPGVIGAIFDVVTHPMVIAGAIMSIAYPVATAENLLNMGSRAAVLAKRMAPGMRYLSTFRDIYGPELAAWMDQVVIRKHAVNQAARVKLDEAIAAFQNAGGQLNKGTEMRIGAWMDGLHKPNHSLWKQIEKAAGGTSEFKNKKVLINSLQLSPQEQKLAEDIRGILLETYNDVHGKLGSKTGRRTAETVISEGLGRLGITKPGKLLEDYFPRVEKLMPHQIQSRYEDFLGNTTGVAALNEMKAMAPQRATARAFAERSGTMIPHMDDLKAAGLWNDDLEKAYRIMGNKAKMSSAAAKFLGEGEDALSYYGLGVSKASGRYVHSMANTYAWDAPLSKVEHNIVERWGRPIHVGGIEEAKKVKKEVVDILTERREKFIAGLKNRGFPDDEINRRVKKKFGEKFTAVLTSDDFHKILDLVDEQKISVSEGQRRALQVKDFGIAKKIAPVDYEFSPREYLKHEMPLIAEADPLKAAELKGTFLPALSGQLSWEQSVDSLAFSGLKQWGAGVAEALPLPKNLKSKLSTALLSTEGWNANQAAGKLSGYLYDTTLGFNVVSPMKNLLQHVITTAPTIGMKDTMTGMTKALTGFREVFDLRRKGFSPEAAFEKVFPEFMRLNPQSATTQHLIDLGSATGEGLSLTSKGEKAWRKFADKAMTLFTKSEQFNRLTTFYGARAKAVRELPGTKGVVHPLSGIEKVWKRGEAEFQEIADMFAQDVTQMTQFGGGPMNTPLMLLKGPMRNPLLRQYQQFSTRILHFGLGPAWRLGGRGGINPGTAGRALLGSGLAYGIGKELLDTDISGALAFGAVPQLGDENSPFGIFPFVSPAAQLAGSAVKSVATGDYSGLRRNVPMLVPAGIQAARLSTAAAPPIAEWLGRPFADYSRTREDGRIPVYTKKGSLQGYFSPIQLWSRSIGLGNAEGTKEVAMARWLLANRDRIREVRASYIEAIVQGDSAKVEQIQKQYRQMFPGMGDIQVKKSDIKAYQERFDMPRLERIIESMPKQLRPLYSQILAMSMGHDAQSFLGLPPDMIPQQRNVRNAARIPNMSGVYGVPADLQQGVQGIRQQGINRVQY